MTFLSTVTTLPAIPALFTACAVYIASTCIYRLYLHPLSRIPGPALAALTPFYEAWYNLFAHDGRFIFHARENLHDKYGPIVRIAPNEVAISDPDFYNKVHYPGSQFEKDPVTYDAFGFGDSIFTTPTNELHAKRRAPIKDYFARRSILAVEPVLLGTIKKLLGRMDAAVEKQQQLFDLQNGLRATSVDMSTTFSFNFPLGMLDMEDLGKRFSEDGQRRLKGFWVVKYFPWLPAVLSVLPKSVEKWMLPAIQSLKDLTVMSKGSFESIKASGETGTSIFHHLLSPENMKRDRLSDSDIIQNGVVCFAAGAETVSYTLIMTAFGVVSSPDVEEKLYKELREAFPDPNELCLTKLEKLPYLIAVVKEGLRLAPGAFGYTPRVTPKGGITYKEYTLPHGSVISTSAFYLHHNPAIFANSEKFDPERWLSPDSKNLEKYLVPFGRGQRMCVGMNLAYSELYLVLGSIFRRYQMDLHNTSWEDVKQGRDYFSAFPAKGSRDFTVKVQQRAG
ncbi:cytochrome P450 [Morchella snyderi]|nr:cytochrome P450 [Morchella snyderi]